jgi:hypothetical protein
MKKIFTVVLVLGFAFSATAQYKRKPGGIASKPSQQSKFLEMQWWLGFKAGTQFNPSGTD